MSSNKTKTFSVSGASTPLTAVAAEPLSISESVAPPPQPREKSSSDKSSSKKSAAALFSSKKINGAKKDIPEPGIPVKDSGGTVAPTEEDGEVPDAAPQKAAQNGSPTHSSKASSAKSYLSASVPLKQQPGKPQAGPWGVGKTQVNNIPSASEQQQLQSQQLSSQTPSPRVGDKKRKDTTGGSGIKYNREALLEEFNALQKERKALRKRNTQAQTNIAQYMRKHR